ncbi:MAG: SDR family oxidoreductase [Pseudomonas sp.]|nr:SDR family oxidoreductase [Pseudomonas sp.]
MSTKRSWSTADIPSQAGRLAVVTGGNSGIGFEAAKALALAGAEVIIATRSERKGEEAVSELRRAAPGATISREALDLSSLASIEAFSDGRHTDGRPIDLLLNNAGIMAVPARHTTADGFEMQLGTNFLGHYALTARLLDLVLAAPAPRVVTVSSTASNAGKINLDDLGSEKSYSAWSAYGQSKLATSMLFLELDRRARFAGWNLVSAGAQPGLARTNLQTTGPTHGKDGSFSASALLLKVPGLSQDAAGGALPTLRAATDPAAKGGDYFGPKRFRLSGPPVLEQPTKRAKDQAVVDGLFAQAEQLTGLAWPPAKRSASN